MAKKTVIRDMIQRGLVPVSAEYRDLIDRGVRIDDDGDVIDSVDLLPPSALATEEPAAGERPQTTEEPDHMFLEEAREVAGMLAAEDRIQPYLDEYLGKATVEAERTSINGYANEARKRLSGGKKQKQLT
jgi:hypothetical protein